uniref:Ion transport domain-containing protein n=1 Tax=Cryptomonas curvata TaxID=233186 RepID=A0A7S0M770_9CRYP
MNESDEIPERFYSPSAHVDTDHDIFIAFEEISDPISLPKFYSSAGQWQSPVHPIREPLKPNAAVDMHEKISPITASNQFSPSDKVFNLLEAVQVELRGILTKIDMIQLDQCEIRAKTNSSLAMNTDTKAKVSALESRVESLAIKFKAAYEKGYFNHDGPQGDLDPTIKAKPVDDIALSQGNDGLADSKRLKERLKSAMKAEVDFIQHSKRLTWKERVFGICESDARLGVEGSRLIHPNSPFMRGVVVLSGLFLIYTSAVVPVQLFMWNYDDPCNKFPTLFFDVAVDSFFLLEVLLQFAVGTLDEDGGYCDDAVAIARRSLSSPAGFWFDAATSVPFSFLDFKLHLDCVYRLARTSNLSDLRIVRIVKVLRILRILRILKAIKFIRRVEDFVIILIGPGLFKIGRLLSVVLLTVHVLACLFWRVKLETADPAAVADFLATRGIPADDLTQIYTCCFYFIWTVFTTVGFGDISATTTGERVFCIFLFVAAATIFGTLVSQINEIISASEASAKERDRYVDTYLAIKPRLPMTIQLEIRSWERFNFSRQQQQKKSKEVLSRRSLPERLRIAVARNIENNLFSKVAFLREMDTIENIRSLFSAELFLKSQTRYFPKGTLIADSRDVANGLMVIAAGHVGMELPLDSSEADVRAKNHGGHARSSLYVFGRG